MAAPGRQWCHRRCPVRGTRLAWTDSATTPLCSSAVSSPAPNPGPLPRTKYCALDVYGSCRLPFRRYIKLTSVLECGSRFVKSSENQAIRLPQILEKTDWHDLALITRSSEPVASHDESHALPRNNGNSYRGTTRYRVKVANYLHPRLLLSSQENRE